ncbi:MAG: citrate/2-methylcitrate synthase [Endomicrobia bacterium]|nr:citrate/2-methylcitrate synthase [Endomicrobiia bacterium]MCL2506183.1 citrate/2-methylcitrate synthase [Endomicrobiia bacterium]
MNKNKYSEITPQILELSKMCEAQKIPAELYTKFDVKRGLRDQNGNGVLTGLSNISVATAKKIVDGVEVPTEGKLIYQGIDVEDIVAGFLKEKRFGFEETVYLLLFGHLPNKKELEDFTRLLMDYTWLPTSFVRDVIMKATGKDMMNTIARSVLTLYNYDDNADDISIPNVLRQCLHLIAVFPMLAIYGYQAYMHYEQDKSLIIHKPNPSLSFAENILHMLRVDQKYTELEAQILDLALVLHADHSGGNNSTFTIHVVSSTDTDTYSAMAAALGSLKGPKHGGANNKVMGMMDDLFKTVKNPKDEDQLADYLQKLLNKEAYDNAGLIYGMGHAVYSISDPRAVVFESFVKELSVKNGREDEYEVYAKVARLAPKIIAEKRKMFKGVSANIDFYSGFVYDMLGLPPELYTPIFAISRVSGWSAHRIEEIVSGGRIIRPAYKSVAERKPFIPLNER